MSTENTAITSIDAGLACLGKVDCLLVRERERREKSCRPQKYLILSPEGRNLFFGKPTWGFFLTNGFQLTLKDFQGKRVLQFTRPYTFLSNDTLNIFSVPGHHLIGKVVKKFTLNESKFDICNGQGRVLYKIKGPLFKIPLGKDQEFKILDSITLGQVGRISKDLTTTGFGKDNLSTREFDCFDIVFPIGVNVDVKATFIGACIFIDLLCYSSLKVSQRSGVVLS